MKVCVLNPFLKLYRNHMRSLRDNSSFASSRRWCASFIRSLLLLSAALPLSLVLKNSSKDSRASPASRTSTGTLQLFFLRPAVNPREALRLALRSVIEYSLALSTMAVRLSFQKSALILELLSSRISKVSAKSRRKEASSSLTMPLRDWLKKNFLSEVTRIIRNLSRLLPDLWRIS